MWKDCETNTDLLDFDYLIEITKDIILNEDLSPSSIGIYGDWGCGKSSLIEMTLNDLSTDDNILCLKFNGWLFEGYEDAKTALIGTILDKISEKRTLSAKATDVLKRLYENVDFFKLASKGIKYGADFLLTGGIGTIADITIQSITTKVKEKAKEVSEDEIKDIITKTFKGSEIRNSLKSFQNNFADLLAETKIKKLVVFIDELDRCNNDTILETLEAIRLFLFTKGTSFIIGADERHVMYAVRKKFPEIKGNQLDIGKEYLEKMIQYPVKIPQLGNKEVEFYILCLLLQDILKTDYEKVISFIKQQKQKDFLNFEITFELLHSKFPEFDTKIKDVISLSKQLSSVLTYKLNGNPRHCKRFLNSLSMRLKMAQFKGLTLDRKVLAKIMLLEYFKDGVYKEIGELQAIEKGKPKEIKMIENDKWEKVEKLKLWKDDTWFNNWVKIEPNLGDIDLQPYYYFTRESLKHQSFAITQGLSPEAKKILTNLMSGVDSSRNSAIKNSTQVNSFEASEILKALISEIETSSTIKAELFKSFIEWGAINQDLYSEVLAFLNRLPSDKLKASFIPRIEDFGKKTSKITEVTELISKWKSENTKLKNA
jgi:predicted KAP-like P-loop ATPase